MIVTLTPIKNLSINRHLNTPFSDELVGQLSFEKLTSSSEVVTIRCTNNTTGLTQIISVPDVANSVDATFTLEFALMGFSINGQTTVDHTCQIFSTVNDRAKIIAESICNSSTDIHIRAALPVDVTIPFGVGTLPSKASADLSYGDYLGWVLYQVPSKDELSSDASAPNNMWQPYFGEWNEIPQLSASMLNRIKAELKNPLAQQDGSLVPSFGYVWNDYILISDAFLQNKYDGTDESVLFIFDNEVAISSARLSVYLNGIYQPLNKVSISKNSVSCRGLAPKLGDTITAILKAYTPSAAELAFDPDASPSTDNPIQTVQYKYDYQYTSREIRDASGTLVNTLYYFWVANKNLTTLGRLMSLQSAKNLLKVTTNPYAVLQNVVIPKGSVIPAYDQFIGMALNRVITEDDSYKIRFTRDFILRDDPVNTELKNLHTEWTMIREHQNTLIPEQLWNVLVDAACGENIIGSPVPSLARVAYDERNGTSARYGFGDGQAFVDKTLALNSIKYAIVNTSLAVVSQANGGVDVPDPISFIDPSTIDDLFTSPAVIRKTLIDIWTQAKPKQVNEIFFTVLYDALSENYEFTDIFKTSMIAAHSVRVFSSLGAE